MEERCEYQIYLENFHKSLQDELQGVIMEERLVLTAISTRKQVLQEKINQIGLFFNEINIKAQMEREAEEKSKLAPPETLTLSPLVDDMIITCEVCKEVTPVRILSGEHIDRCPHCGSTLIHFRRDNREIKRSVEEEKNV